jgi:PqqD family protein of HPr-rel-A system
MPQRFLRRTIEDEEFWLDLEQGRFYGLNETGAAILEAWRAGARDPAAITARLAERFAVDAAAARPEVAAFLEEARRRGLLDD